MTTLLILAACGLCVRRLLDEWVVAWRMAFLHFASVMEESAR